MPTGLLTSLFKAVTFCVNPTMTAERNVALSHVLDNDPEVATVTTSASEPDVNGTSSSGSTALYEEHLARVRAEAEAQDKSDRLRVAQEQLAEYAEQKEKDAEGLFENAQSVEQSLHQFSEQLQSKGLDASTILQQMQQLKQRIADAASEAQAFAAQQKADVERSKRSSQQADLPSEGLDVEMKRPRESMEEDPQEADDAEELEAVVPDLLPSSTAHLNFTERAKYIPIRLSLDERRFLRLLEAALNVSEYTDKVDIFVWKSKNGRIHAQIKDICAILSGLVVAQDYKKGQALIQDRNFKDNADFFQTVFEIGRRYKIMNPDKMRSEYGKLMYMLMDSAESHIQDLVEFKCVKPLKTVYSLLEAKGGLRLLEDPLVHTATAEIIAADRPRYEVQRDISAKEKAREVLSKRYRSSQLSEEEILWCLYSISDNNSFLLFNRDPIDRMIQYFRNYFRPDSLEPGFSLGITGGRNGARLTHNHERQYNYVLQSLTLWRELSTEMFKLWYLAESDMLREGNTYRLCDTGQGLNRVQAAPQVAKTIHQILSRCQAKIGQWVGSSVVHLGDHNVPNALMFIDKYTQVPRILNPVVLVLDELPKLYRDPHLQKYIDSTFGGVEACRKTILADFCKHAFDGSGADNFFDAGSCIDGRLTSAWNWCSKVEKKSYYHLFRIAGFVGFDGDFK